MNKEYINKIQTKILELIPKDKQSQKGVLFGDSCSELSRLVGVWIKEDDSSVEVYILKGENVCNTKKSHDIIALDNSERIYLIDPTVWQFFPGEKSILVNSYETLDEAVKNATKKYSGKWKISEKLDNITLKRKEEWLRIIKVNICKN